LFGNIQGEKALTVYTHISIPPESICQDEENYFIKTNATRLLICGTVAEGKGQKDAILAVKELIRRGKDVELIIMGHRNTEYASHLESIVKDKKLEVYVRFIGFKKNPYPIMNQADIILVCSRNEAFGRVTVEGMLLKKPVIGTSRGGTLELIKEGFNGLLYEPGDFNQLAKKIEYLIEHSEEAKQLAENGYRFAEAAFTRDEFGGKIYKLLRDLKHRTITLTSNSCTSLKGAAMLEALFSIAADKDPNVLALFIELGSTLRARQEEIVEIKSSLQARQEEIAVLRREIAEIQGSLGWRLVKKYRSSMDKFFPPQSAHRRIYEMTQKSIKKIFTQGPFAFGNRFAQKAAWILYRNKK